LDESIHELDVGQSLKLELDGLRCYRVGRFRIIYKTGLDKIVELVAVGPGKSIYEETYRLIANLE